eukprot:SAG22_NODE_1371_length_4582_cov_3.882222_5_plen_131_part_00
MRNSRKLLPLMHDCRDVVMRLLDGADGREDGQSTILNGAYDDCCSMPTSDLINALQTPHERGQCPNSVLDSLAETDVELPECSKPRTTRLFGVRTAPTVLSRAGKRCLFLIFKWLSQNPPNYYYFGLNWI